MSPPAIAIIGRKGQIAEALVRAAARQGVAAVAAGRPEADLADCDSIASLLLRVRPRLVINAAAYTAVDQAEKERDAAFAVNAEGPGNLARLTAAAGIPLVHISTDYVFDGRKATPYTEDDPIAPLGVYGASKAAGEEAVRRGNPRHLILRTSWVFSADGANFVKTMLRLGQVREELGVVSDQTGCPTYAGDFADAVLSLVPRLPVEEADQHWGTYHLTNRGSTTWHGFAEEIFRQAKSAGLKTPRLKAITTADYPTPARRPANSILDNGKIERNFGITRRNWCDGLGECVRILASSMREGDTP